MIDAILKKGKERSLLRKHPWVFSGAVAKLSGTAENGETVRVLSSGKQFLAYAAWSGESSIALRVWTFREDEQPGPEFFQRKFAADSGQTVGFRIEQPVGVRQSVLEDFD